MSGELESLSAENWHRWLEEPVPHAPTPVKAGRNISAQFPENSVSDASSKACYTCSECSGCCPIYSERPVFDPHYIVRMANFGLIDESVHAPSIWLCLRCELCGAACGQKVRGYKVIRDLQALAMEKGAVDPGFPERLSRAERVVYQRFIPAIDALLKASGKDSPLCVIAPQLNLKSRLYQHPVTRRA